MLLCSNNTFLLIEQQLFHQWDGSLYYFVLIINTSHILVKKNREDILKMKENLKPKTKQINLLKILIL